MPFALLPLSTAALEWLAASRVPDELAERAEPESMPPAFVAARALKLEATAEHQALPTSYLIVRDEDSRFVGACGFKTPLGLNRVEVGFGVAPATRGQGAATAALKLLTELALESGSSEVLAEILPGNVASIRVAQKAGFVQVGARVDEDNEYVTQWLYRSGA
jgi:RimJ/RimL family protein N-acetyltransferase